MREQEEQESPEQRRLGVHVAGEKRGRRRWPPPLLRCVPGHVSPPRGRRALSRIPGQRRPFIPGLGLSLIYRLHSGTLSSGRGNALCPRPYSLGVGAGERRPCIEMGLVGGAGARGGHTSRSLASRFLLSSKTPGAFPPHPQPFLERAETPAAF